MVKRAGPKYEKTVEKADWVKATPFKSPLQTPVTKIVKPVNVQIMRVSIKGSCHGNQALLDRLICLSCSRCNGSRTKTRFVREDSPRHTILDSHPNTGTCKTPTAAVGLKAEVKMRASVAGISRY